MDQAANLDVPVAADAVDDPPGLEPVVQLRNRLRGRRGGAPRRPAKIFIDARYTDQLQILPGYRYPWEFRAERRAPGSGREGRRPRHAPRS